MHLLRFIILSLIFFWTLVPTLRAQPLQIPALKAPAAQTAAAGPEVLNAEQAFVLAPANKTATGMLHLNWRIAPGYYLYRDQIQVTDAQGVPLTANIPAGQVLTDAFFGTVQVFHDALSIQVDAPAAPQQWPLQVRWQGCAEIGVCYPPQQSFITAQQAGLMSDSQIAEASATTKILAQLGKWVGLPASIVIGPMALPTMALTVFLAFFASQWWAKRQQLRSSQPVESLMLHATLAGLVSARLAYVAQWWREYFAELPAGLWRVVDIRDGGWNLWAGVLGAVLWTLWRAHGKADLRRGTLQAVGLGALIVIAGHALRSLPAANTPALSTIHFVNTQAQAVDLRSYQGQPLVINLWATWCPPCRREMPVLQQAQKDHPDVRFIWINQGEQAETVMRYLSTMQLPPAQVLLDPEQQASKHWQQRGLPSTYFYDASGQMKSMRMGELSRASLAEHLSAIRP